VWRSSEFGVIRSRFADLQTSMPAQDVEVVRRSRRCRHECIFLGAHLQEGSAGLRNAPALALRRVRQQATARHAQPLALAEEITWRTAPGRVGEVRTAPPRASARSARERVAVFESHALRTASSADLKRHCSPQGDLSGVWRSSFNDQSAPNGVREGAALGILTGRAPGGPPAAREPNRALRRSPSRRRGRSRIASRPPHRGSDGWCVGTWKPAHRVSY